VVAEVKERLEQAQSVVVTEYRGLSVKALAELRRSLRPAGGAYKVYKNTLVRRAAADAGLDMAEHLSGPTALAFTETTPEGDPGDVVIVAKVLRDFAKTYPDLVIKGGLLDGAPLDASGVQSLADVEPREVLLARLAGALQAPMQQFAGLLEALPRNFAYGLQALIDQRQPTDNGED
jgi:large subunit ribosomal protein L10